MREIQHILIKINPLTMKHKHNFICIFYQRKAILLLNFIGFCKMLISSTQSNATISEFLSNGNRLKKAVLVIGSVAISAFLYIRLCTNFSFKAIIANVTSLRSLFSKTVNPVVPQPSTESIPLTSDRLNGSSRPFEPECFPIHNLPTTSLEESYKDFCILSIDTTESISFRDYLSPNEKGVVAIQTHLKTAKPGLLVSTGTVRCYYDLALSNADCTGLVTVDINPRVKAFNDFNTMLLRIAKDREDFLVLRDSEQEKLSKITDEMCGEDYNVEQYQAAQKRFLKEKTPPILERLQQSDLPPVIKEYYLKHFDAFADVYYIKGGAETGIDIGFDYAENEKFFLRVKTFADAGRIISIRGDIGELAFLDREEIAIVDTSNITSYSIIDFKAKENFRPQVIHTCGTGGRMNARYFTTIYKPLSSTEREEFNQHISFLERTNALRSTDLNTESGATTVKNIMHRLYELKRYPSQFFLGYHQTALENLRVIRREYCFESPTKAICLLADWVNGIQSIKQIPIEEIQQLCKGKGESTAKVLIPCFESLSPQLYRCLAQNIDGWREAEEAHAKIFADSPDYLAKFNAVSRKQAVVFLKA